MERPLFSCVVPVKGPRPYLDAALGLLRNQGLDRELEIIIQDGDLEPDGGQSDALNRGFAKAHGEWLFWLNADDLLLPGALHRVQDLIDREGSRLSWIVGDQVFIDGDGRIESVRYGTKWLNWAFRHLCPHVNGPSSFFRRELLERVGGLDASLQVCMDWDLWIRFAQTGARWVRIPELLWAWRRHEGSKTSSALRTETQIAAQWREIRTMAAKNHFDYRPGWEWLYRAYRVLDGSLLKSWIKTIQWRKKAISLKF